LRLHFSGTLLGNARRTGLLPVCGRNLYNCLCSLFFCSLHYSLHIDSELTQTLNLRTVLKNVKEEVSKNTIQPPLLVVFLTFRDSSNVTLYEVHGIPTKQEEEQR